MEKMMMDDDVRALVLELKAVSEKLRAKGLDDDDLKDLLLVRDEKGISLSPDGTLTLLDYDKKVKLSPMERALYTLLLNHEDGIRVEDLWMYYDELVGIYGKMTWFDDPRMIEDAVDTLCDDSRVTFYSNLSRIKRKLTEAGGSGAAQKYAILRGKDNVYRVAAPRGLVQGTL